MSRLHAVGSLVIALIFVVSAVVPGTAVASAPPGDSNRKYTGGFPNPSIYEVGSREWFRAGEALAMRPLVSEELAERCPHSFDVLNYDVTMTIDVDAEVLYGNTRVTSVSQEASLSSISLDFAVLTVDSVLSGADTLAYVYADSVLAIDLGQSFAVGDTFEVRVVYHGTPGNEGAGGFGGFWFEGAPVTAFQMGVGLDADPPSMGKFWIPCWDAPCDKATADYRITIPGVGKKVVANGVLVSARLDSVGNTATYVWSETHQIAPHLMTVHARKFAELVDSTYDWIHYWVYPTQADAALTHFANVDLMMDAFIDRYGPYPFSKFGYVSAPKGDMEHQTCVTHNASTVVANHNYDWLLAHEMSHQWWGDLVSVNDWRDVWLSEGFATYSEAVFWEHAYGAEAYRTYMLQSLMTPVLNSGENFPIYDPNYLWGTTVYEKGGCVLHMLRHVVGDSAFFDALAAYRQAYAFSSAVTGEFQAQVESVAVQDLGWFFDEWIYDRGWPVYEYSWQVIEDEGQYSVNLVIDQVQTNGPVFTMPVDVEITTSAGDTLLVLPVDAAHEVFDLVLASEPTAVTLDPDRWILKEAEEVPYAGVGGVVPAELRLEQNVPNPFSRATSIRYSVPRAQGIRLEIYDAAGRQVVSLIDGPVGPGWREVTWDARDRNQRLVAPGTYFCRLSAAEGRTATRMIVLR
jgi:aminopeptidase N